MLNHLFPSSPGSEKTIIHELSIRPVNNGFMVHINTSQGHYNFAVQSETNEPDEIEEAIHVVRECYHGLRKGSSNEQKTEQEESTEAV